MILGGIFGDDDHGDEPYMGDGDYMDYPMDDIDYMEPPMDDGEYVVEFPSDEEMLMAKRELQAEMDMGDVAYTEDGEYVEGGFGGEGDFAYSDPYYG